MILGKEIHLVNYSKLLLFADNPQAARITVDYGFARGTTFQ